MTGPVPEEYVREVLELLENDSMTYDTDSKERAVTTVKKQISFEGGRGDYRQEVLDSRRLNEENAPVRANSNMPKKSEELLMEAEDLLSTQR